jgi:hypothetical protein
MSATTEIAASATEPLSEVNLNGVKVVRRDQTQFIVLPPELWREIPGGCGCRFCSADGKAHSPAYWDTLAINVPLPNALTIAAEDVRSYGATVHYPEIHGIKSKL